MMIHRPFEQLLLPRVRATSFVNHELLQAKPYDDFSAVGLKEYCNMASSQEPLAAGLTQIRGEVDSQALRGILCSF